ncbi:hypothetical protein GCM10011400_42300 [Paraburkholderia caffeinilytica]|uniref:Uncharacterized protein n=2 Tax=Paraburkholderia caffeinilytica TaxID=1761016 RepID=A0ABQ1N182_9BURK|nr:hypothetical protein GCM10011400_42300 [Paraburkholderia caffeinilytica]
MGKNIATGLSKIGIFSDVSIYKYGTQYALVQENHSNDRLVTAIPITKKKNKWISFSVYYFSISLMQSTAKTGPLWVGRKITGPTLEIDEHTLDNAGNLASEQKFYSLIPSGWPSAKLYVATDARNPKGEQCFVPFDSQDSTIPIDVVACRPLRLPVEDGDYDLSGVLDKNLFIAISITKHGDTVTGQYRYLRHPDKFIKIEGTLAKNGSLSLTEFGGKGGAVSGYFHGLIQAGKISGEWETPDKSKCLPFSIYQQGFSE